MSEPSPSPAESPPPRPKGGNAGSLALAVGIAAVGGFILARLGGNSPPPAAPAPVPAGVAARAGTIRAEGIPPAEVLDAIRKARARRPTPADLSAFRAVPDPGWIEQVQKSLRSKVSRCAPEGGPHGAVMVRGVVRDAPAHLAALSVLQAPPELASAATCVAAALDGAPVPELEGPAADATVSLRFDL